MKQRYGRRALWVAVTMGLAGAVAQAQMPASGVAAVPKVALTGVFEATLPEAPEVSSSLAVEDPPQPGTPASNVPRAAGKYDTVILPGQTAARLTARDKLLYGVKDSLSPISIFGWGVSAGYEQLTDGAPNYGVLGNTQTGKSFAQRLGAAAARSTSETIFAESILAPVFHEDPRYYAKTDRKFLYRVVYAGTRAVITKTDSGRTTVNFANIGGNLAGSALTQAYYPPLNRGFGEVATTFAGSIAGSAFGNEVSEFLPGLLVALHFKKKQ